MPFCITQLPNHDKLGQTINFPMLEHCYPPAVTSLLALRSNHRKTSRLAVDPGQVGHLRQLYGLG